MRYGQEQFFVPEGEGLGIERRPVGEASVRVAVAVDGRVAIGALLVKGEPRYIANLF